MTTTTHQTLNFPRLSALFGAALSWHWTGARKLSMDQLSQLGAAEQKLTEMEQKLEDARAWGEAALRSIRSLDLQIKELEAKKSMLEQRKKAQAITHGTASGASVEDEVAAIRNALIIK